MRKLLNALAVIPVLAVAQVPAGTSPYPGAPPGVSDRSSESSPPPPPRRAFAAPPPPPSPPPTPGAPPLRSGAPPSSTGAGRSGGAARAEGKCVPLKGRFLLAFNKAEIVDVLEQASRWTCRNFAYTDEVARGKITLLSKTPVTAEEAYAAFLAALTANNIAVYPSGKYYKLVRIADAKKAPIPTFLAEGAEVPAEEQPVTKLFRLRYADPDQIRGVMGNFLSPQGSDLQAIPPDVLIITDLGLNVRRIERMLEALDKPGAGELIRFIQIRYASAKDLAEKVNQVFQASPTQPGKVGRRPVIGGVAPSSAAPGTPGAAAGGEETLFTKVMPDERTNKLVVIADDKSFQRVRDLVDQLDIPAAGEGQIHVLFMKNASAEDLAQTLSALAQGQSSAKRTSGSSSTPGAQPNQPTPSPSGTPQQGTSATLFAGEVKITADKVSNALLVMASGADFATIERLVDKLDRPRRQVFVEAVIIEVNLNDETQFGVGAHAAVPYTTSNGTGFIPLASEPSSSLSSFSPLSAVSLGGFLSGFIGPTSTALQGTAVAQIPSIGILIQALQTSSNVKVISTPHILATDNEDAEITVGQNVPFQAGVVSGLSAAAASTPTTGTTSSSSTGLSSLGLLGSVIAPIQRQNVELRLRIKPQITEGDNIRLQIDESNEDIASKDPVLGPTTNKRTIKTNISVKDQGTIVIGGLIQDQTI
ncbi:MAG TPA: type II secretion system secretin GspD, partial [Anaeromyxobacteraceae bacterium]|nr:type II secretion system secretin GspD [Anaeromyxobacteraceae bacterium]